MINNNTKSNNTQQLNNNKSKHQLPEVLLDNKNNKVTPWRKKKIKTHTLSIAYHQLAYECSDIDNTCPSIRDIWQSNYESKKFIKRAYATEMCATFLEFKVLNDSNMRLFNANFCKVRLCPMCAWRRSLKLFGQISKIMDTIESTTNYKYIFITLTQKNVKGVDLITALNNFYKGFKNLTNKKIGKKFNQMSRGWYRALEITHDTSPIITKKMYYKRKRYYDKANLKINDLNPNYNTYHPHFHLIVAVDNNYFTSNQYMSTEELSELWKKCLNINYEPIVDMRRVTNPNESLHINNNYNNDNIKYGKVIAEIAKYTTKSSDYLYNDKNLSVESVYYLDNALANRRLIGYGGIFRQVKKQLKLDNAIDGNLINVDGDELEIRDDVSEMIVRYNWQHGFNNYIIHKVGDECE